MRQATNENPNVDSGSTVGCASRGSKRLLMIAAAFPPAGGSGVQRTAKFAKYLPECGWLPTVWTVDRIDGLPQDPTLLSDLGPDVTVCRWNRGRRARLLQSPAGRFHRSVCATKIGNMLVPRVVAAVDWRLKAWRRNRPFPDEFEGWARASVSPLLRLIDEQGIDAIYSTYSPASNHLLGLILKQQTSLPWVADFRDLWTEDFRYKEPSKSRREADQRLEQQILEQADIVIGVTPSQTRMLAKRVPDQCGKFRTITNGYDPDDFARVGRPTANSEESLVKSEEQRFDVSTFRRFLPTLRARPFTLSFVGRFERYRAHEVLLAGLLRFVDSVGADRSQFVLRIVGHSDRYTRAALSRVGIPHELTGYVSHAEAISEMVSADALLLSTEATLPNTETVICAKIFEYLASRRPILVVGPDGGECERIVQAANAGLTVTLDEKDIADALIQLYQAKQSGRPLSGADVEHFSRYSRKTLTQGLANVLDGMVSEESFVKSEEREENVETSKRQDLQPSLTALHSGSLTAGRTS